MSIDIGSMSRIPFRSLKKDRTLEHASRRRQNLVDQLAQPRLDVRDPLRRTDGVSPLVVLMVGSGTVYPVALAHRRNWHLPLLPSFTDTPELSAREAVGVPFYILWWPGG